MPVVVELAPARSIAATAWAAPPPQQIIIRQINAPGHTPHPRWSPTSAALLSPVLTGAGQLYKGQPIKGIVRFVFVLAGDFALILPEIVLHVCYIAGAAMGDPYR